MEWFRWYHGTVSDPKFSVIARRSRQPRYVVMACWPAILEHASTRKSRGSLEDIDLEEIAVVLDLETEHVEAVYQAMVDKGMVEDFRLKNWEKRQPVREDETAKERKEKWKANKKQEQIEAQENAIEIQGNASGTQVERNGTQENAAGTPGTCKNRTEQNREEKTINSNNNTRENFFSCFKQNENRIRSLYPHADFEAERETCLAHYGKSPPLDPYPVILKWFNRIPKPKAEKRQKTFEELKMDNTKRAMLEFVGEDHDRHGQEKVCGDDGGGVRCISV